MILLLMLGCATTALYEVDIEGEVSADQAGVITLSFHFAWWGEGDLRTPLQTIDVLSLDGPGAFAHTIAYPIEEGEGLVVYGWQDRDGDGALCTPGVDDEPAGLAEVEGFPSHEVWAELTLDQPCAGSESLFPR